SHPQAFGQGSLPRESVTGAHALAQQQIQEAEGHGTAGWTTDADGAAGRAGLDVIGAEREDRDPTTFRLLRVGCGCSVHSSTQYRPSGRRPPPKRPTG